MEEPLIEHNGKVEDNINGGRREVHEGTQPGPMVVNNYNYYPNPDQS